MDENELNGDAQNFKSLTSYFGDFKASKPFVLAQYIRVYTPPPKSGRVEQPEGRLAVVGILLSLKLQLHQ